MKLLLREKLILGFYFIIGLAERKINKNSAVEWDKYFLSMKESFLNRYFIVLYFISTVLSSCIAYVLFSVFEFQNPLLKTILLAIVCIVLSIKRYKAKEYDEIAAQNKKDNDFDSSDEFLSNFKKTDRLHPVISLCVYYGEREWDGSLSLKDMLKNPEELEAMIADYKMNLIQVRSSESLKFCNSDVDTVFDVSRDAVVKKLMKDFVLSEEEASDYVSIYW